MANSVKLNNENVDFSQEGKVVINDNNLANELLQNQDEALQILSNEVRSIDISKITFDSFGRINVNDPDFLAKMKEKFEAADAIPNGLCVNIGC